MTRAILVLGTTLAVATGLALPRGSQNANTETSTGASYCILEQQGHPTIDLNPVGMQDQDYSIGSHVTDGYDYVINVCNGLNYNDDSCHEGSAVCQRHRHTDIPSEVFGYTGSTKLSWSDQEPGVYGSGSKIVMEMSGAPCWTNNATDAKTTIDFVCSQKEFLVLTQENYEGCNVAFTFYTHQACGSPRYSCSNGTKCIAGDDFSDKYGTFQSCRAECGTQPSYACVVDKQFGFQCIESESGKFQSYSECSNNCTSQQQNPGTESIGRK